MEGHNLGHFPRVGTVRRDNMTLCTADWRTGPRPPPRTTPAPVYILLPAPSLLVYVRCIYNNFDKLLIIHNTIITYENNLY